MGMSCLGRIEGTTQAVRGGGVLLYVRESLSPGEFRPITKFPEHVWCSIKGVKGQELLVGVCYRSGSDIYLEDSNDLARDLIVEVAGQMCFDDGEL